MDLSGYNRVDKHVAESMLRYWSIAKTRIQVLEHALCTNGNALSWVSESEGSGPYFLECEFEERSIPEKIPYFEFDELDKKYGVEDFGLWKKLYNHTIDFCNDHFDAFVKGRISPDNMLGGDVNIYPQSQYARMQVALDKIKPEDMEESWRKAMREVGQYICMRIRQTNSLFSATDDIDDIENENDKKLFIMGKAATNYSTDEERERTAKTMEMVRKMIDEIKEEV